METLEAVARAICIACEESPDMCGDAHGNKFRWQDYSDVAAVAIAAMVVDGVLVRLVRPDGYEDAHPDFVAHDALSKWGGYEVLNIL